MRNPVNQIVTDYQNRYRTQKCQRLTIMDTIRLSDQTVFTGILDMGMNINLTPYLESMVRQKVESGLYTSASEVLREALRLMDEQDKLRATKLEQLRQDIRAGLDSGAATTWDPAQVKRAGHKRRQSEA
jgi:antitoxin ParD1/3/4